jgi:hypothetical protein
MRVQVHAPVSRAMAGDAPLVRGAVVLRRGGGSQPPLPASGPGLQHTKRGAEENGIKTGLCPWGNSAKNVRTNLLLRSSGHPHGIGRTERARRGGPSYR